MTASRLSLASGFFPAGSLTQPIAAPRCAICQRTGQQGRGWFHVSGAYLCGCLDPRHDDDRARILRLLGVTTNQPDDETDNTANPDNTRLPDSKATRIW